MHKRYALTTLRVLFVIITFTLGYPLGSGIRSLVQPQSSSLAEFIGYLLMIVVLGGMEGLTLTAFLFVRNIPDASTAQTAMPAAKPADTAAPATSEPCDNPTS